MRLFGLLAIIIGCLMGAPAIAMLAGGKAAYREIEQAFGPFFPYIADAVGGVAEQARVTGGKMLATALVMIFGGVFLRRRTRESEDENP